MFAQPEDFRINWETREAAHISGAVVEFDEHWCATHIRNPDRFEGPAESLQMAAVRTVLSHVIAERAFGILGELLFKSAEEKWSFADFIQQYYMGFTEDGVFVTPQLGQVQDKRRLMLD